MKPTRRKTLLLLAPLVLIVALASWCFRSREPFYQGKSLSYWLYPWQQGGLETSEARAAAFRAMGEPAVPYLTHRLEWKPSGLMQVLHRRFPNWTPGIAYAQGSADPRSSAAFALGEMGPTARMALPALDALTNASDLPSLWYVKMSAKAAAIKIRGEPLSSYIEDIRDTSDVTGWYPKALLLGQFGTNASAAVPLLLAALDPTNHDVIHGHALIALGEIRSQPESCVPAIAGFLNSPSVSSRQKAMGALWQFGPDARSAAVQIEKGLLDSDPWTRHMATNTLKHASPENARRAGIP